MFERADRVTPAVRFDTALLLDMMGGAEFGSSSGGDGDIPPRPPSPPPPPPLPAASGPPLIASRASAAPPSASAISEGEEDEAGSRKSRVLPLLAHDAPPRTPAAAPRSDTEDLVPRVRLPMPFLCPLALRTTLPFLCPEYCPAMPMRWRCFASACAFSSAASIVAEGRLANPSSIRTLRHRRSLKVSTRYHPEAHSASKFLHSAGCRLGR